MSLTLTPNNSVWCWWIWGYIWILSLIWEIKHVFLRLKKIRCFRNEERKARNNNPKKGSRSVLQKDRCNLQHVCAEIAWAENVLEKFQISPLGEFWPGFLYLIVPASWTIKSVLVWFCKIRVHESFIEGLKSRLIACALNLKKYGF